MTSENAEESKYAAGLKGASVGGATFAGAGAEAENAGLLCGFKKLLNALFALFAAGGFAGPGRVGMAGVGAGVDHGNGELLGGPPNGLAIFNVRLSLAVVRDRCEAEGERAEADGGTTCGFTTWCVRVVSRASETRETRDP